MSKDKETTTTTKTALKDDVLALATKLEKGMTVEKKTGAGSTGDADLYHDNLPESLTPEVVKAVGDYNANFIAAGAYAFGKLAVDAMKGNKSLEQASIEVKMGGRDTVAYTVDRHTSHANHLGGGEPVEKYGVVTAKYSARAGKGSAGQLKVARNLIGELAMEKLKG